MKRFNYTGRKKILRDDIDIRLRGNVADKPTVDVALNLNGYDFPPEALVFIEPQRQTRFMRILLGYVSNGIRKNNIPLEDFDDAEGLKFKIKIVDEPNGLLLGVAEHIHPHDKDEKQDNNPSLLAVASRDLSSSGVLWCVEFDDEGANLIIEKELGNKEQVVRSHWFRGFILPSVMQQVLMRITLEGDWDTELSEPQEPSTAWLLMAKELGAGDPPAPDSSVEDKMTWVEEAVTLVVRRMDIRQSVIEQYKKGKLQ